MKSTDMWQTLCHLATLPERLRTLSAFTQLCQSPRILPAFTSFCKGGPYAFFDGESDSLALDAWTTFEMRYLLSKPEAFRMPCDMSFTGSRHGLLACPRSSISTRYASCVSMRCLRMRLWIT